MIHNYIHISFNLVSVHNDQAFPIVGYLPLKEAFSISITEQVIGVIELNKLSCGSSQVCHYYGLSQEEGIVSKQVILKSRPKENLFSCYCVLSNHECQLNRINAYFTFFILEFDYPHLKEFFNIFSD